MAKSGTVYVNRQTESSKLRGVVRDSENVIFEVAAVFPFELFPDKLIIDKTRITIVRRALFYKRLFPISLSDLQTVRLNRGLLFAALEFEIKGYNTNPGPIEYLWPSQAGQAQKVILGLIEALKQDVNLSDIKRGEIREQMGNIKTGSEDAGIF